MSKKGSKLLSEELENPSEIYKIDYYEKCTLTEGVKLLGLAIRRLRFCLIELCRSMDE